MAATRHDIDMTEGPLLGKIIRFAIPVALANLIQLAFDAADMAVIGKWSIYGHKSLAAIGATNTITGLLVIMISGIAGGANVVAAQCYGAQDKRGLSRVFHTGIALGMWSGLLMLVLGVTLARPLLELTRTPDDIIDQACLYLRLRFLGVPFSMVYMFGCLLMRAVGDTRRPLWYLTFAGIVNLLLNMLFVIVFKWDVAGVAFATGVSKALSAFLVLAALMKNRGACRVILKQVRMYVPELKRILYIGVPSGLQSACYSISNVIIAAAVNTLGAVAIAGNTVSAIIEGLIHIVSFSMYHSVLAFGGQNYGARKYDRAARAVLLCLACSVTFNLVAGWTAFLNGKPLLLLLTSDPAVIEAGMLRFKVSFTTYFIAGALDIIGGGLRSQGRSLQPMIVTILCVCVFRIIWIFTVFPRYRTLTSLYISYPISWTFVVMINGVALYLLFRKLIRRGEERDRYGSPARNKV